MNPYAPPVETRSTQAIPSESIDRIDVKLNTMFFLLAVPFVVFTAGLFIVALAYIVPKYPRLIDDDGITTYGGKRFPWSSLTAFDRKAKGVFFLVCDRQKIAVPLRVFRDGDAIANAILKKTTHLR